MLLVPTVIWVRLRLPRLRRTVEFICLLPLTIPAIVLVVGLAPVYAWVTYLISGSSLMLTFAYTVLALPYAYRSIDAGLSAIDVRTLSEAARSLGAGWGAVMWRVVLPNIRSAVLSAAFLTVALVLGEFTIASLLNRDNVQVAINLLGKSSATSSPGARSRSSPSSARTAPYDRRSPSRRTATPPLEPTTPPLEPLTVPSPPGDGR